MSLEKQQYKEKIENMNLMPNIANMPLMISEDYANALVSADYGWLEKKATLYQQPDSNRLQGIDEDTAIISVSGPLSQKGSFWSFLFGGSSYEEIRAQYKKALNDDQIKTIIFDINSPGGVVSGAFDLVDEIYGSRGKKRTIAYINEMAYSAAYAIASAADEIHIPRTGGVGSIGVIAMHVDQSQFDQKIGVKYTPIFAGKKKNDFSSHEPLSKRAYEEVKSEIDDVYNIFTETVARNKEISIDEIKKMEAGIYQGQKAVDVGLADEITTHNKIFNIGGINMTLKEKLTQAIKGVEGEELAQTMEKIGFVPKDGMLLKAESDALLIARDEDNEKKLATAIEKARAEGVTEGMDTAKKAVVSILELCAVAGNEKIGLKLISDGATEEEARKQLIKGQTNETERQNIISTVNPLNTGEINPLIADAQQRAKVKEDN